MLHHHKTILFRNATAAENVEEKLAKTVCAKINADMVTNNIIYIHLYNICVVMFAIPYGASWNYSKRVVELELYRSSPMRLR